MKLLQTVAVMAKACGNLINRNEENKCRTEEISDPRLTKS